MDRTNRRGMTRSYGDRTLPGYPRWARNLNTFDVDSRPGALAYPQYGMGTELVTEVSHMTPALYPADPPLYPDAGRYVLVNQEPSMVPASYLPPAGSQVFGLNSSLLAPTSSLVPVAENYYTPMNPLPPSREFQDPLSRPLEYGIPSNRFERHMQLSRRSSLPQNTSSLRRRAPLQKGRLQRQATLPAKTLPAKTLPKKQAPSAALAPAVESKKIKKHKKKGKKAIADTAAAAAVAADGKIPQAKTVKQQSTAEATPKATMPTTADKKSVDNPVAGMIFGCNEATEKECKRLQIFGMPATRENDVLRVVPGCKLFLFNFDTKELAGVYEAVSSGALNIRPDAFKEHGSFPAQVKTRRIMRVPNLTLPEFKKAIKKNFYSANKFKYELTADQVDKLVELFSSSKGEPTA